MGQFSDAAKRASHLVGESWFTALNGDTEELFGDQLATLVTPNDFVSFLFATPVDTGKATPGALALLKDRCIVMWGKGLLGRKREHDVYRYGSGVVAFEEGTVRGIPHPVVILMLGQRRVVMPSVESARLIVEASDTVG